MTTSDPQALRRERDRLRQQKRRQANPEKYREDMRRWRAQNPEKVSAWKKRYYEANRERILEQEKERYESNKQLKIFQSKASRARLKGADVDLLPEQWEFCLRWWGTACPYCNRCMPRYEATLDHFLPLARGGHHSLENVLPCCLHCNSSKRDMDVWQWLEQCESLFTDFHAEDFMQQVDQCARDWNDGYEHRRAA